MTGFIIHFGGKGIGGKGRGGEVRGGGEGYMAYDQERKIHVRAGRTFLH